MGAVLHAGRDLFTIMRAHGRWIQSRPCPLGKSIWVLSGPIPRYV